MASETPRYLRIAGGTVYDPRNGVDGAVADVWVSGGQVVAAPAAGAPAAAETIDAAGLVVMPGGVDMHTHVAGPKLSLGRFLRPEEARRAAPSSRGAAVAQPLAQDPLSTVPTPADAGRRYAAMGYTTIVEAAVPPLFARQTHQELNAIPYVDRGFLTLMGNNALLLDALRRGERTLLRDAVAWLLSASRGYGIKLANPGGVENWKWRAGGNVAGLDEDVEGYGVTPRAVITALAEVAFELGLPHRVHLHANNLGGARSFATMAETIAAVDGRPVHLAHLQFSAYGPRPRPAAPAAGGSDGGGQAGFTSRAPELAELVNARPNLTLDVGQVVFGEATTMSADAPLQAALHRLTGNRWANADVENETGTGVMPYHFSARNYANAVQWTAGLELFLLVTDPWRLALTTDHPNGGPFTAYPAIIRLLMDADHRAEQLAAIHERAARRATLRDLRRVYTLGEIAVITRAAPARLLGLAAKGHLGVGADADVALYRPQDDKQAMFARPAYVLKGGALVARDGALVAPPSAVPGRTLFVSPPYDPAVLDPIRQHFTRAYTVALENYAVGAHELAHAQEVPCTP